MPQPQDLYASPEYYEVTAAWVDDDAIKTSVATSVTAQTYSGGALNGAVGANAFSTLANTGGVPAAKVTATLSSHAASYSTSAITVTGTNEAGETITDTLTPTTADGNETLETTKAFATVTSIAVPAQPDALGAFKFGIGGLSFTPPARWFEAGKATTGAYKVKTGSGRAVTLNLVPDVPRHIIVSGIDRTQADFPFRVYR